MSTDISYGPIREGVMSDLKKRLRDDSWRQWPFPLSREQLEVWHSACCEAAGRIEELEREAERLRHTLTAALECWQSGVGAINTTWREKMAVILGDKRLEQAGSAETL